jgi:hypothetical protein
MPGECIGFSWLVKENARFKRAIRCKASRGHWSKVVRFWPKTESRGVVKNTVVKLLLGRASSECQDHAFRNLVLKRLPEMPRDEPLKAKLVSQTFK